MRFLNMHYLIDGYNFLFWQKELWPLFSRSSLRQEREHLIEKLIDRTRHTGFSCRLVFDAHHTADDLAFLRQTPLDIIYTPKGMTADEYILECLYSPGVRKSLCVVTQDKGLRRKVMDEGIKVIDFAAFIVKMDKKRHEKLKPSLERAAQPTALSPKWVAKYTEIFEQRYGLLCEEEAAKHPKDKRSKN
jgi:predicted RNA-binding protein with PIN domain